VIKSRFWSFESSSIQLKFSNFFWINFNPYEEIKTKRFLFFSIKKIYIYADQLILIYHAELKQNDFYFLNSKKYILNNPRHRKWCKCNFFNPYFVQMNRNRLKFSIYFNFCLLGQIKTKLIVFDPITWLQRIWKTVLQELANNLVFAKTCFFSKSKRTC